MFWGILVVDMFGDMRESMLEMEVGRTKDLVIVDR
jgi:hypothetical protein